MHAYSSRELKARSWGFSTRIYKRDNEPIMYWMSFMSFLMAAVFATVFGVLAAWKSFFEMEIIFRFIVGFGLHT
jgi:hypothetical protein